MQHADYREFVVQGLDSEFGRVHRISRMRGLVSRLLANALLPDRRAAANAFVVLPILKAGYGKRAAQ